MDFINAIILGIVEGLTEFLPISSTGHLIIVNQWIAFDENFTKVFDIVIQFGAILAVVLYFWDRLYPFSKKKNKMEKKNIISIWYKTLLGVIPALIIGGLWGSKIEELLFKPEVVALSLFVGGIILIAIEKRKTYSEINNINSLSYSKAFIIGIIQCLAMIPGTSRSAATIVGAMLLGTSRLVAVEFSFFLAVPTIFAATCHSLLKSSIPFQAHELLLLATGLLVSFLVAWGVISSLMAYISRHNFKPFGYYRIILGFLVLLLFSLK